MSTPVLNKTEESVFTLLSLYILISQAFQSLFGEEDILNSDFGENRSTFSDLITDTIHEALVYQILLKACAYMDEWNNVFGVRSDPNDFNKIKSIKRIAGSAVKCISNWKHLRDFRNQAIAHNHRDKQGKNIYLTPREYNSPQSNGEIALLVFCLEKMTDVVNRYFPNVAKKVLEERSTRETIVTQKFVSKEEAFAIMQNIEQNISLMILQEGVLDSLNPVIPPEPKIKPCKYPYYQYQKF